MWKEAICPYYLSKYAINNVYRLPLSPMLSTSSMKMFVSIFVVKYTEKFFMVSHKYPQNR